MKVVITVVGKDKPGIIANVGKRCSDHNGTIVDITQKVLQDLFTMIMIVELPEETELQKFSKDMQELEVEQGIKIHVMHEDIFNAMHTI